MSLPLPEGIGLRLALQEARLRLESALARFSGETPQAPRITPESISRGGRVLAELAALPLPESERGNAIERIPITKLDVSAGAAASELKSSFEKSGLFYEAHLRAWNSGEFALADLRREPQARLGESGFTASGSDDPRAPDASRADPSQPHPPLPVPRELERLVREQLATLETRTAVVPLALWPGQEATLSISDEPEPGSQGEAAPQPGPGWRASLTLRLPCLGEVRLTLAVRDELVRVSACAAEDASRRALAAQAPLLETALRRNALVLERMDVTGDER